MATDEIAMNALRDFFDFPWPSVFAFAGLMALILFTFGPHLGESFIGRVIKRLIFFFGAGLQEFVGVTALRNDMNNRHADNLAVLNRMGDELRGVKDRVDRLEGGAKP